MLQYDALLDPSNGADPAQLTPAAQSIRTNHLVAQQQVELAIRYLRSNEAEIIAGRNAPFNSIYGRNIVKQKVAILRLFRCRGPSTSRVPLCSKHGRKVVEIIKAPKSQSARCFKPAISCICPIRVAMWERITAKRTPIILREHSIPTSPRGPGIR